METSSVRRGQGGGEGLGKKDTGSLSKAFLARKSGGLSANVPPQLYASMASPHLNLTLMGYVAHKVHLLVAYDLEWDLLEMEGGEEIQVHTLL